MVNIGIVCYNRLERTLKAIECIRENLTVPYLVTIVDNGSNKDVQTELLKVCGLYGFKLNLLSENFGAGVARQLILMMNTSEYVFFIDNDILIQKNCVENLLEEISKDNKVIGVCAKVVEDSHDSLNGMIIDKNKVYYIDDEEVSRDLHLCHGGAVLFRKDAIDHASYDFDHFCQDLDFSLQLTKAGFKLRNCPSALTVHWPSRPGSKQIGDEEYNKVRRNADKLKASKTWFCKKWGLKKETERLTSNINNKEKTMVSKSITLTQGPVRDKNDQSLYYIRGQ